MFILTFPVFVILIFRWCVDTICQFVKLRTHENR